jgi:hypothetical protein
MHLSLDNNNISGPIPESWQVLPSILSISLDNNALTGTLPLQYSNLDTLQLFSARNNNIYGVLHGAWNNMQNLTGLGLSRNLLEGSLPREFSTMSALQALALGSNAFSGNFPIAWTGLTALRNLDLAKNFLTGTVPLPWDNLAISGSLVNFWVYDNDGIGGGCFPSIELAELAKGPPGLVGSLFDTYGYSSAGAFDNTGYSGGIVECGVLTPKREVSILLAGKAALDPTNASSTLALWNSSTPLCSQTSVALWPGVTCIFLFGVTSIKVPSEGLMGTLPAIWSRLYRLETLDLSSNSLRGTLPPQWSEWGV